MTHDMMHDESHHMTHGAAKGTAHAMTSLAINDLCVDLGGRPILKHISATFRGGEIVGVIGQNGGGKTTLLKALAGLLPRRAGTVTIVNEEAGDSYQGGTPRISYVPQLSHVASRLSVFEMVLLGLVKSLSLRVTPEIFNQVDETLHAMGINKLAQTPVCRLSGGQKQLVFMAQAFVSRPRVLLLDEPTSALDLRHQLVVMNAARRYTTQNGVVTLVVVHDLLTAARFSDRLLLLADGGVRMLDTPSAVLDPEALSEVYQVSVSVEKTKPGFLNVVPIKPL